MQSEVSALEENLRNTQAAEVTTIQLILKIS